MTSARSATQLRSSRWRNARWLVLAPHADDETIGAGALIAQAAADQRFAGVVFVTDGSASHGPSCAGNLPAIRRAEARVALRRLALQGPHPVFLNWPDARPPERSSPMWARSVRFLGALCRSRAVDAIATTSALDPHCDHQAASALAREVARTAMRRIDVFDYVVWADQVPRGRAFRTELRPQGERRLALAAHRSQMTPLHGEGFRVPERLRRMAASDVLYAEAVRHAP